MDVPGEMVVPRRRDSAADAEDTRFWAAVQNGDDKAFEELVTRHCGRLAAVAGRLLRNPADVEEVVQEAFVRAFETRARYPHVQCVRSWFLRIAINLCNSRRRTGWWRRILLTGDYRGLEPAVADPGDLAERGLVDQSLREAVNDLPETLQLPFLLRYTEELSGAEIAAVLGLNESTVWSRIYLARRRLRERLGDALALPHDDRTHAR
jgi:RNA polymerase sigma-70 factor, ECF subfamily